MAKISAETQNGKLELTACGTPGEILGLLAATEDAVISRIADAIGLSKDEICVAYNQAQAKSEGKWDVSNLDKILTPGMKWKE